MDEDKIYALSVGELKSVTVRFPKNLLDALIAAAIKKSPALSRKQRGAATEALIYFSARGLLDWQDHCREDAHGKKGGSRSLDK